MQDIILFAQANAPPFTLHGAGSPPAPGAGGFASLLAALSGLFPAPPQEGEAEPQETQPQAGGEDPARLATLAAALVPYAPVPPAPPVSGNLDGGEALSTMKPAVASKIVSPAEAGDRAPFTSTEGAVLPAAVAENPAEAASRAPDIVHTRDEGLEVARTGSAQPEVSSPNTPAPDGQTAPVGWQAEGSSPNTLAPDVQTDPAGRQPVESSSHVPALDDKIALTGRRPEGSSPHAPAMGSQSASTQQKSQDSASRSLAPDGRTAHEGSSQPGNGTAGPEIQVLSLKEAKAQLKQVVVQETVTEPSGRMAPRTQPAARQTPEQPAAQPVSVEGRSPDPAGKPAATDGEVAFPEKAARPPAALVESKNPPPSTGVKGQPEAGIEVQPPEEHVQGELARRKIENTPDTGPQLVAAGGKFFRVSAPITQPVEPARLAEAHRGEVVDQVSRGVASLVKGEISSVRLQLHPAELGRIDLHISAESDGTWVTILADLPGTGQLIERHLGELRQSLQEAGVNLAGLTVGQDLAQGGVAGERGENRARYRTLKASRNPSSREDPSAQAVHALETRATGMVDYRV